jgi:hypothetical protein
MIKNILLLQNELQDEFKRNMKAVQLSYYRAIILILNSRGSRWSSGQCAWRSIAEAKHRSQWPVIGWVTKIYYLELLRASEGTLYSS